jgi:hypothetical protein
MLQFDGTRRMEITNIVASGGRGAVQADAVWGNMRSKACVFLTFDDEGMISSSTTAMVPIHRAHPHRWANKRLVPATVSQRGCQAPAPKSTRGGAVQEAEMGRLDGRVAVITGGASGMGEAATRLFVREGARVVIGDVQKDKAEALAAGLDGRAVALMVDVSRSDDVKSLVDSALSRFGRLDVMFNNAGIVAENC